MELCIVIRVFATMLLLTSDLAVASSSATAVSLNDSTSSPNTSSNFPIQSDGDSETPSKSTSRNAVQTAVPTSHRYRNLMEMGA